MKIIGELAASVVNAGKKDALAVKTSILLAVIMMGSIVFDVTSFRKAEAEYFIANQGDYHASIAEVDGSFYDELKKNPGIEKMAFDRIVKTDRNAVIYEREDCFNHLKGFEPVEGRRPEKDDELLVPDSFLMRNRDLHLNSTLEAEGKTYRIVGVYENPEISFDESYLIGRLGDVSKDELFEGSSGIEAYIWYKNPRDTYTLTREILQKRGIDPKTAESQGRLGYNTSLLNYKMIYPNGIIPPRSVISQALDSYIPISLLALLFAFIIYGAFNVWNSRDQREIALLKSVGMTEKQVKKMIRRRAFLLARGPILLGTALAYGVANGLLYLMWRNNAKSIYAMSDILSERIKAPDFQPVGLSPYVVLAILILSAATVYLSAMMPAKRCGKLNIIEGLNGLSEKDGRLGPSKVRGKIERTLAKDYYLSYKRTYRTILLSTALSAVILTVVMVSGAYGELTDTYDKFRSPYSFSSTIFTPGSMDPQMTEDLKALKGADEWHFYRKQDFKCFVGDNGAFFSAPMKKALKDGKKSKELYARMYGLTDEDYEKLLEVNGYDNDTAYLLLNKTAADDSSPYAFRKYIPVTDKSGAVKLRYAAEGKVMAIGIGGVIDEMPYAIEPMTAREVSLFTRQSTMEAFFQKEGHDPSDPVNYYNIKMRADKNVDKVSEDFEKVIASYIPKTDHSTLTQAMSRALDNEAERNVRVLNGGIQGILILIALTNAYNSFIGNLRARKREFQLLMTAGMTQRQMKSMVYREGGMLFLRLLVLYGILLPVVILGRSARSKFAIAFAAKNLFLTTNYLPIALVFVVMGIGISFSIRKGLKQVFVEDLN
ncbi:ABC transporter permease [Peptoniphilus sp. HCN-40583]|uniref:ABC transporter permease n=1 Tax=Peptoniphilus sp. HCN-40583 TaxID=3134662 RepID=UPI0030C07CE2